MKNIFIKMLDMVLPIVLPLIISNAKVMKTTQVNSEIKETRTKMEALKVCMKDSSISIADRKMYYGAYLSAAAYLLKLESIEPDHNLTIA